MTTRYQCALDGVGLHTLDDAIIVTDIQEHPPVMRQSAAIRARYEGSLLTCNARQSLTVTIRFLIREYDVVRRKAVMRKIAAWAAGGKYLTIGDRPGQRLRVSAEISPTLTSALKWTEELSLSLTARATPYWQAETPVAAAAGPGTSGTVSLTPNGDAPRCFLEFHAVNQGSGALNRLTVGTPGASITLSGLGLAPGAAVDVAYDEHGLLTLPARFRTAQSSDDLPLSTGLANAVSYSADQPVAIHFSARGFYL